MRLSASGLVSSWCCCWQCTCTRAEMHIAINDPGFNFSSPAGARLLASGTPTSLTFICAPPCRVNRVSCHTRGASPSLRRNSNLAATAQGSYARHPKAASLATLDQPRSVVFGFSLQPLLLASGWPLRNYLTSLPSMPLHLPRTNVSHATHAAATSCFASC